MERKTDMNEIYAINDLSELEDFLHSQNSIENIREKLFAEFLKYADYKSVSEWNKAVRLCECLAVIGWGNHEPLEASRGVFLTVTPVLFFATDLESSVLSRQYGQKEKQDLPWSRVELPITPLPTAKTRSNRCVGITP